jgi:hypothetical protein
MDSNDFPSSIKDKVKKGYKIDIGLYSSTTQKDTIKKSPLKKKEQSNKEITTVTKIGERKYSKGKYKDDE